jgi:hypothetical protein
LFCVIFETAFKSLGFEYYYLERVGDDQRSEHVLANAQRRIRIFGAKQKKQKKKKKKKEINTDKILKSQIERATYEFEVATHAADSDRNVIAHHLLCV